MKKELIAAHDQVVASYGRLRFLEAQNHFQAGGNSYSDRKLAAEFYEASEDKFKRLMEHCK